MGEDKRKHLKNLLESFDTGMLITHHGEKDHARPMAVAKVEGSSALWFVTNRDAPKSEEIRGDSRVSATFQSANRFVALSGIASLVSDRAKIRELWRPSWRAWFPNGKNDPDLVLIRVVVTDAEYWDTAGVKKIRFLYEAAKAIIEHKRASTAENQYGRVRTPLEGASPPPSH